MKHLTTLTEVAILLFILVVTTLLIINFAYIAGVLFVALSAVVIRINRM